MKHILSILIITFTFSTFAQQKENETTGKFEEVFNYLSSYYVDEFDGAAITDAAIVDMLKELDPHSYLISKEEVQGAFVSVRLLNDEDKIVAIDGETVAGVGLQTPGVRERLMGTKGSLVVLGIKRRGENEILSYDVRRDKIPLFSVVTT